MIYSAVYADRATSAWPVHDSPPSPIFNHALFESLPASTTEQISKKKRTKYRLSFSNYANDCKFQGHKPDIHCTRQPTSNSIAFDSSIAPHPARPCHPSLYKLLMAWSGLSTKTKLSPHHHTRARGDLRNPKNTVDDFIPSFPNRDRFLVVGFHQSQDDRVNFSVVESCFNQPKRFV